MKRTLLILAAVAAVAAIALWWFFTQMGQQPDSAFDARVAQPAYASNGPSVLFDEAHDNIHRANGKYKPFATLITNDGYQIRRNQESFAASSLRHARVLVIANAKGKPPLKYTPAFTAAECDAVEQWVRDGGSLLLITDHFPIGSANEILARRFGIDMCKGEVADPKHHEGTDESQIVFENDLLGDHPILRGRSDAERIRRVMTFTGQSLSVPPGATPLLKLSPTAVDMVPISIRVEKTKFDTNIHTTFSDPRSAAGRAQAIAFEHGKGRVVITGEAAMLTAQRNGDERFGMQVPGIDNRQLALNIMHWLTRVI